LIDHPVYSLVPLFASFPVLGVHRYRATGHRSWLVAAAFVIFVASNYLIYAPFLMILVWLDWRRLKLIPLKRRELLLFLGLAASGIVLHLLQTVSYSGGECSRRSSGSRWRIERWGSDSHELREFYDGLGFLLSEVTCFPLRASSARCGCVLVPGRFVMLGALLLTAVVSLARKWGSGPTELFPSLVNSCGGNQSGKDGVVDRSRHCDASGDVSCIRNRLWTRGTNEFSCALRRVRHRHSFRFCRDAPYGCGQNGS